MRRHVLVGRLGPNDRTRVPAAPDEVVTKLELVASERRLEHGIGRALEDCARRGLFPTEVGLDLLVLAAHVHAADTRISRVSESQDTWTREIRLVVPVSEPAQWERAAAVLQRMLNFLTGDRWVVGFRARPSRFGILTPRRPPGRARPSLNSLALFSGGLDSLIGAIDALEAGRNPLFVSHAGEGATSEAQNGLFDALKRHYRKSSLDRLRLWMNFPEGLVRNVGSESTTRGRSFLFIALGVFAGTGFADDFTLSVPENGFIALNVPLDPLRLGALSTRTTHPFYLARWNELLGVIGISGRVENPFWDKTKGEMVVGCANSDLLRQLSAMSLSCASPTKGRWQGRGIEHCGYCLPCLIRRASMIRGFGAGNDPTPYTLGDLRAHALDTRQSEGQQVRSFQMAIERLKAKPAEAALLIHKPGPLSDESPARQAALAGVYKRGLDEVATLLTGVSTRPG
ncbi:MAG: hypothetical protein M5U32_08840 [Myxococcota bacterium]|nr:hypothetical protein [Myxococcota bacterium]